MNSTNLMPSFTTHAAYREIFLNDGLWDPVMEAIQLELLEKKVLKVPEHFERCRTGSAIVYRSEHHVLKLFSRLWPEEFPRERAGLKHFSGLSVPVPELVFCGEFENEPYMLMERLPGDSVVAHWNTMSFAQKKHLITQIGQLMRALKSAGPAPPNLDPAIQTHWPDFVNARCESFVGDQINHGLSENFAHELHQWLMAHQSLILDTSPVLLHCDLTHDHFLVQVDPETSAEASGRYRLTGLIDFGDAMMAHPLYEMGAPLTFLTAQEPELRLALLTAYGFGEACQEASRREALEQQLFCLWLLHRFVNVPYTLKHIIGVQEERIERLQKALFSLSEP